MSKPFIRPVRGDDFDDIFALAQEAGGGMTNLPADEPALRARIDFSVQSFAAGATEPGPEVYMLVLEQDGRVVGTSAVFSAIGLSSGFVNYKVNWMFHASEQLGKRISRRVLVPTHDFTGAAEVGSLFVSPKARGSGVGKFLARSRYLFIAQSPHVVSERVCAELRGWRAPDGAQPFWDALGKHFFDMDFEEADVHNAATGNQFIADLMPRYPIYVCLLPQAAIDCLGRPHDNAAPAFNMLLKEGFAYNDYIDIFDGGPLVDAATKNIRTVKESRLVTVSQIGEVGADAPQALIACGAVSDYRATIASIKIDDHDGSTCVIDAETAAALCAEPGAQLRWARW